LIEENQKRLWKQLYKVIDSSDVLIQVLDARDPMGTRSSHIEKYLLNEKKHKHLVFLLNKCDLVPTWATARWVRILSKEYPTLAFHASLTNPFGKGSLIQLLRQFSQLHSDKPQITVGFIGYPNVGKSSVINTLRSKKVCAVAPIPGETKVWQYITLMKKIYLVDCPGVVQPDVLETEAEIVLKGVVRVEKIEAASDYIAELLKRVKKEYITKLYGITEWQDHVDFLEKFAQKTGRLLKKGEPDLDTCAKMILHDWQKGKIPFFVCPPFDDDGEENGKDGQNNKQNGDKSSDSLKKAITTSEKSNEKNDGVEKSDQKEKKEEGKEEEEEEEKLLQTKQLPKVDQLFHKIKVAMEFDQEDLKETGEKEQNTKKSKHQKQQQKQDVDWDEVYKSVEMGEEVDEDDIENSLNLQKMEKSSKKLKQQQQKNKKQQQKQQQKEKSKSTNNEINTNEQEEGESNEKETQHNQKVLD